jgi:arsenate reductase (thioredoxin)
MTKKRVLVLCTGNSCRSQIAHGYLTFFGGEHLDVRSAGIETHGVNPKAIDTMKQDGIDISHHTSNHINEYANESFDYVITVCDNARENCPFFPASVKALHHNFPDPAKASGTPDQISEEFKRVRNMIKHYVQSFVQEHLQNNS